MAHNDPIAKTSTDITDPFRLEPDAIIRKAERSNGSRIEIERLRPGELQILVSLGRRVSAILVTMREAGAQIMPPHPGVAGADWTIAHLARDFDLMTLARLPDDDLLREYVQVAKHIDRTTCQFSSLTPLRYARK